MMESLDSVPESLSVDQIKAHLASFRSKLSSSALNSRVCGIKYYFRKVVHRPDLAVGVPNPRVAKYVQEVLSEADLLVLFRSCQSMRELAMLQVLYDLGLRSREVCNIKLTDFDKVHRLLTIRNSKGGKMRTVPYSLDLRLTLEKYFRSLRSFPTTYLFENRDEAGKAITIRGVQYIVGEVVKRSRLKRDIHPHTFRHTFAIHYINNGGNLLRLKELLGHENIETTLHYLKFCSIPLLDSPSPLTVMLNRNKSQQ
jgi:site-specific recombinase XerD